MWVKALECPPLIPDSPLPCRWSDPGTAVDAERGHRDAIRRKAGCGIKHAAAFLSVGLVLEVVATIWAFAQAVSSGLFDDPRCDKSMHEQVLQNCKQVDFSEVSVYWDDKQSYVGCEILEDPIKDCNCSTIGSGPRAFSSTNISSSETAVPDDEFTWTAAKSSVKRLGSLYLAIPVLDCLYSNFCPYASDSYASDWTVDPDLSEWSPYLSKTENPNPSGFEKMTVVLLVVGLGLELVEGIVGYMCLKAPLAGTGRMTAGSVVDATGILTAIFLLLFSEEGLFEENMNPLLLAICMCW